MKNTIGYCLRQARRNCAHIKPYDASVVLGVPLKELINYEKDDLEIPSAVLIKLLHAGFVMLIADHDLQNRMR